MVGLWNPSWWLDGPLMGAVAVCCLGSAYLTEISLGCANLKRSLLGMRVRGRAAKSAAGEPQSGPVGAAG